MTRSRKSAKLCKHVSLHNAQHNMRRRQIIAFTVAIIVVVILLYIYAASDTEIIRDIISGTVVSIIASLVLYILTEFVFCDNSIKDNINEIKESIIVSEDIKRYGIKAIKNISYTDANDTFWLNLLNSTEERLDIMAHTLSPWFQEDYKDKFIDRISYLAKKGKTVNILILKPYGKNLASMDVGNIDDYSKKIEKSLTKLRVLYLELPAEAKKYVHIKLNGKYNMPYTYIRNECQTYISPCIIE